jgi:hypothetical protein
MSDQHTQEGQVERAKRLRAQIENLKSGQHPVPGRGKSLREQIDERAHEAPDGRTGQQDESREP